ncbi:putative secreted protein [Corynebacterium glutamicum MB001]|uniref:DUF4352 domain-containing protein n=1 Tax=Corynebacterium glutamicum (strain ATCC 13032 / DSM 20300 / JCM 1318 / BCRC 11384 / CCUG 27702 / LMG 3730 / NBRC 12168 / NCIMB 10025 / NRRL B-2784 / 534) TaxID=196627 RepID=Q8NN96_CORGL|nr:hypothetical protein [Corynebacterium glutamicum]AGT06038.1 putative secreted protein [Corynebacterium glutamicum MB001]ARV63661.1 hypothetical protein B7P23_01555 [Corynebacterium glutamicum]ASW14678.1 putative secreted protein [Corynebacterium glutamicum]AUI01743.1 hypothetical protein CYL77_11610 [Corynebacterium glutamicum]AUI05416.1 hypothetical protein C0I99_15455 [Corynebacterium glutamicum]
MKLRTIPALLAVALLAGCSGESADSQAVSAEETMEVTTTSTPVFEAKEVSPITVPSGDIRVEDPGLNVEFIFRGTRYGTNGGSIIHIAVKNLNDVALPADAIDPPTLDIEDYNGNKTNIETLSGDDNIPLDLPLGAGATTNLQYAFNTSNGSLSNAKFQIGNVIYSGNLNSLA